MAEMTKEKVAAICKKNGFFTTPELNEQLHLHFHGFYRIENLEEYVACRVLWLESNAIDEIENLEKLPELRCLYLQHNNLRGLGSCSMPNLDALNVSHNKVASLAGLEHFAGLSKLLAAGNHIADAEVAHLLRCPKLDTVDLSNNELTDFDGLLTVLQQLKALASLALSGNELTRTTKMYRRRLISALPGLKKLDDTPVFDDERRCAVAWAAGGPAAERAAREEIRKEAKAEAERQRDWFNEFLEEARKKPIRQGPTAYADANRPAADAPAGSGEGGEAKTMGKIAVLAEIGRAHV